MNNHILSERCLVLRDDAMNKKSLAKRICAQWPYYFRMGECAYDGPDGDNIGITASGVAAVIENAAPVIAEGELIVGYNFGDGAHWGLTGDRARDVEIFRENGFTDAQIELYYRDFDCRPPRYNRTPPEDGLTEKEKALQSELAAVNSAGQCSITCNHSVLGYERVLSLGFEGLLAEAERYEAQNGASAFYDALKTVCRAGLVFGGRYAVEAERLGLTDIASVCRRVPRRPARTFREAAQSLWFAHIINTWEDTVNANSIGRLDRILYPYYKKDIESGTLTEDEAFEIICCLWIKFYRDYDVQQSCVGGSGRDRDGNGVSQVNELSYLMLDATEALGFVRCLSVRFDRNTDRRFIRRALEVVGHVGKGVPFFFNDDVMIPALINQGIEPADAAGYTNIGCVETVIPGKSNPHAVNSRTNLLKAAEYALNGGRSMINPALVPGIETGDPLRFDSFDRFKTAVFAQIEHMIRATVNIAVNYMPSSAHNHPKPVKSLLTEGCIERGVDFNSGGAKYDYYQLMLVGIPNLADSMAAVRELVFDKKKYTMKELIDNLRGNFPDEAVRLDFLNKAPKYGNDIESVDSLAAEIMDFACDRVKAESERCGYVFQPQPFTFVWMIDHGRLTAATPDGRRSGEILAYSVSPMQGRDAGGFTALLNSLSRLPTKKAPGTTSAIVEADPKLFCDNNIDYFADILLAAASKGLCNVQFNITDAETLRDAQLHPENHRNLAVRVSGYSQKFSLLSRELQDHIIARTKHSAM